MPPVIASEQRTARLSPALSWRPRACPTRTVAARAKLSGIIKISEVKLSAIWWPATISGPSRLINSAITAKMLTSKKIDSPTGSPSRSM